MLRESKSYRSEPVTVEYEPRAIGGEGMEVNEGEAFLSGAAGSCMHARFPLQTILLASERREENS